MIKNPLRHLSMLSTSFHRQNQRLFIMACFFLLASVVLLRAQLPVARLQNVFPAGAAVGRTVEVAVGGSDLDEPRALLFSTTNIIASPKTNSGGKASADKFLVTLHSNAVPGVYEVRFVGRFGISNPRAFAIDTRPEMIVPPTNTSVGAALEVPQGTWINGRVDAGTYAYFRFQAEKGQRLLIECLDSQLDSRLDASLVLFDAGQREVARTRRAGLLDYTATASGTFILRLNDQLFRGGSDYQYRLLISTRPHIDFVIPSSALPGTTNQHLLYGRNLPGGSPSSRKTADGKPLEKVSVQIAMPAPTPGQLTGRSLGMTLAAAAVDSIEYRLNSSNGLSNPVLLGVATAPVVLEQAFNTNLQPLAVPCEVTGHFYPANDRDGFTFEAKKGDVYSLEIVSQRLGLPTDPFAVVQRVTKNAKGEEQVSDLREMSDSDPNFGAEYKTSSLDPSWRFVAPENGTYRILVRDFFSRFKSDPKLAYRLSVRKETPDFRLVAALAPHAPPKKETREVLQWTPVLRKGQTLPYRVMVYRKDNFGGEITLRAEGLPAFVTCPSVTVPAGSNSTYLFLTAATDATDWAGPIRLIGQAKIGNADITREAVGATLNWSIPDSAQEPVESRLTQQIVLSVCASETAPIQVLAGAGKTFEGSTNSKVKIPIQLQRAADWGTPLKLKATGLAPLASLKELDLDGKASGGDLEIDIAKQKLAPGNYFFYLQSEAQGKYQNNPEAAKQAAAEAKEWEKKAAELTAAAKKAAEALKTATKAEPEAKAAAEKALKDAEAKAKEAEKQKEAAVKRAKELRDKAKPKDATIYVYSNPIQLKVTEKATKP